MKQTVSDDEISGSDAADNDSISKWERFDSNEINFERCRSNFLDKFEKLANQFAAGWKYHILNKADIREAWINFEDFYTEICSLATGQELFSVHSTENIFTEGSRTSENCDKLLTKKVGKLASKLSPDWTNTLTTVNEISKAWKDFKHYFQEMCTHSHPRKFFTFFFIFCKAFDHLHTTKVV